MRQPARATPSPISHEERAAPSHAERKRAGKIAVLDGDADRLQGQEQRVEIVRQAERDALDHASHDRRVDADRQMRPMLLDGGDGQHGDHALHVEVAEIVGGEVDPIAGREHGGEGRPFGRGSPERGALSFSRKREKESAPRVRGKNKVRQSMMKRVLTVVAFLFAALPALALDKVSFATNWRAQAEHGGFYQAVVDGTYAKYGLDVTILQGGPQSNARLLLAAGRVDFCMGANLIQTFSSRAAEGADRRRRQPVPDRPDHLHVASGRGARSLRGSAQGDRLRRQ